MGADRGRPDGRDHRGPPGARGARRGRHRLLRAGRELPLAPAERPGRHLHHAPERGRHRRLRGEAPRLQAADAPELTR
ncbi:hypothetical protein SGPA1_11502 [Streptomyces misionensis JCM 4497]